MSDILAFFTNNWAAILAVLTAVFVAVDKIVALTPTKADDAVVAQVEAVLENLGILPKQPAA
jgi:hypothetical protein